MSEPRKIISVLGAGAWGTAIAVAFSQSATVRIWTRDPKHSEAINERRENSRYLPTIFLSNSITVDSNLAGVCDGADYIVVATPTKALRSLIKKLCSLDVNKPLILLCKGFEEGSGMLPHQILREEWPYLSQVGILAGPSFAIEVANGLPAALTLAAPDGSFARRASKELHRTNLRLYSSTDVVGVEIGSALKNVIAIAAGISDGLNLGINARSALITRGLAEITRLGVAIGGRPETFTGLSGIGDLFMTASCDLSRNRQVGMRIAAGERLEDILLTLGHVAEGVSTVIEAVKLAENFGVEMPIANVVYRILKLDLKPHAALAELLGRSTRDEN